MPSIITHAAVPVLIGAALGRRLVSYRLLVAGAIAAMLPDLDVLSFKLGIAYGDVWGHRGALHSLLFAMVIVSLAALAHRMLASSAWKSFTFIGLAALSHPLLDMCTNGGLGVALFWPWNNHRWFAPFRPIEVSPIGAARFLSAHGWQVFQSELLWVWLPAGAMVTLIAIVRRMRCRR